MTRYRHSAGPSDINPTRHLVRELLVIPGGATIVAYANGTTEPWHALATCLQYHGIAEWQLRDAGGRPLTPHPSER